MSSDVLGVNTHAFLSNDNLSIKFELSTIQRMLGATERALVCMSTAGLDDPSAWADYADFCELQWLRDELADLLANGEPKGHAQTVPDAVAGANRP